MPALIHFAFCAFKWYHFSKWKGNRNAHYLIRWQQISVKGSLFCLCASLFLLIWNTVYCLQSSPAESYKRKSKNAWACWNHRVNLCFWNLITVISFQTLVCGFLLIKNIHLILTVFRYDPLTKNIWPLSHIQCNTFSNNPEIWIVLNYINIKVPLLGSLLLIERYFCISKTVFFGDTFCFSPLPFFGTFNLSRVFSSFLNYFKLLTGLKCVHLLNIIVRFSKFCFLGLTLLFQYFLSRMP